MKNDHKFRFIEERIRWYTSLFQYLNRNNAECYIYSNICIGDTSWYFIA